METMSFWTWPHIYIYIYVYVLHTIGCFFLGEKAFVCSFSLERYVFEKLDLEVVSASGV